ncbi:MAG: sensor histidine kinase [Actinomycetota bacterium]|nr:sensor histidine kinase [Actinomycetota bacterium]
MQTSILDHTMFVYREADELVEALTPVLRDALGAGQRVVVNIRDERTAPLSAALGDTASRIEWTDTYAWMPHPARRLRAIEELVEAQRAQGDQGLLFVGECAWPRAPESLVREWERFDVILNESLSGAPASMLCLYDASVLAPSIIDRARQTHPQHGCGPRIIANPHCTDTVTALRRLAPGDLVVPEDAPCLGQVREARAARAFVAEHLKPTDLQQDQREELIVVTSELVANSLKAAAETVSVAVWERDGAIAVQVDDDGRGISDPFAGYHRPEREATGGRGLWMARQLCDVVEISSRPDRTAVRAIQVLARSSQASSA